MYRKLLLILFFFQAFCSESHGQQFPLIHFTTKDGLPSNTVYEVFSDSKGYLWISTDKGLALYNGRDFKTYTTANGLPDNEIFGITEDKEGRLWLITFNGELCFYKNGRFYTKENAPWLALPFKVHINRIFTEQDHSLTILFDGYKNLVNVRGNRLSAYNIGIMGDQTHINGETIINARRVTPNHYDIFTTDKIIQIDTLGHLLIPPRLLKRKYWLARMSENNLLLSIGGLYNLNEQLVYPIKNIRWNDRLVVTTFNGNLWIGSKNGLFINDSIPVIKDHFITFIAVDKEKGYWISTREHGLYYLNKNFEAFTEWPDSYKGAVTQARIIGGAVNFATDQLYAYEVKGKNVNQLFSIPGPETKKGDVKRFNFLINDKGDHFIISSNFTGHLIRRGLNGSYKATDVSEQTRKLDTLSLKNLLIHNRYLYFFEISVIKRVNAENFFRGNVTDARKILDKTIDERIYTFAENKDSSIWISKANGVYRLSDTLLTFQKQFNQTHFREIKFYGNYLLGFTDKNKFLICNNYNHNPVHVDTVPNENYIYEHIYKIDDHRAIISTSRQYSLLQLYPPAKDGKPVYTIQTIEDAFIPTEAEYIVADSNYCYFFKEGTITRVSTNILFEPVAAPTPVFTGFKTDNRAIQISPVLHISYNESKSINIKFDNISYIKRDIVCQYSITQDGTDDWREISGNDINLNTPGYGTYKIKIRSKTLASTYSKPAVLTIQIEKPYWATWWFIGLCAVVLLALIWGIIVFITWRKFRKKQKEHEADMKYQQSEYKALNALMNPHFIFNSLNNIQGLINKDEKRVANQYLVIFSDLVRQNMHNISKGFISLQQELTLIENYLTLEKLRFKELVNYEIQIDPEVEVDDILIPPLMIQPLVENAVKHGLLPRQSSSAKVIIQVYESENLLYIIIRDNGIGLSKSLQAQNKLHESFGLSNLKKRTEHLKKIQQQEITIDVMEIKEADGTVTGTQAIVTIQLD